MFLVYSLLIMAICAINGLDIYSNAVISTSALTVFCCQSLFEHDAIYKRTTLPTYMLLNSQYLNKVDLWLYHLLNKIDPFHMRRGYGLWQCCSSIAGMLILSPLFIAISVFNIDALCGIMILMGLGYVRFITLNYFGVTYEPFVKASCMAVILAVFGEFL